MYTNVDYSRDFVYRLNTSLYNLLQYQEIVYIFEYVDNFSTSIYTVESCIQTEHNIMSDSRTIPVRMPEDLYQEVINSKPAELKVSTYLLLLLRKGLTTGVDSLYTNVETKYTNVESLSTNDLERLVRDVVADVRAELVDQTNELLTPLYQEVNEMKTELMGK